MNCTCDGYEPGSDAVCGLTANINIRYKPNDHGGIDYDGVVNNFPNLEAYYYIDGALVQTIFQIQNFTHDTETVGWLVIGQNAGTWSGHKYKSAQTSNSVTDQWYTISFSAGFTAAPRDKPVVGWVERQRNPTNTSRSWVSGQKIGDRIA